MGALVFFRCGQGRCSKHTFSEEPSRRLFHPRPPDGPAGLRTGWVDKVPRIKKMVGDHKGKDLIEEKLAFGPAPPLPTG